MIAVLIAVAVSLVGSLFGTRYLIYLFQARGQFQPILGKEDNGPEHHRSKEGTPTMGGIAFLAAAFAGWTVAHLHSLTFSVQALIVWFGIFAMAAVGLFDDQLKVRRRHNQGIMMKSKGLITIALTLLTAGLLVGLTSISESISFVRAGDLGLDVPTIVWVVFAAMVMWSTTHAVNITDGLDGLAGGTALMGFGAFTVIAYWAFRNPDIYQPIVNPLDMGVMAAAFAGALVGFLWWNAAPARIMMGDVGALGIGAALALMALTLNTTLLLILICGLNVIEAGSVAIQMGVFRATGRRKRLFRMSPIHHHFELTGWPETTVIVRFWLISAIFVGTAMAIFIADYTRLVN